MNSQENSLNLQASGDTSQVRQVAAMAFATLAELRESDTESHLLRVQHYVQVLSQALQASPHYAKVLNAVAVDALCNAVTYYDLGTIAIPERILLKPGRLSQDEIAVMRSHTTLGYEALVRAERTLGISMASLQVVKDLARSHHEKWDGSGYPQGLRGQAIPVCARILALADVYDALITNKVYKDGLDHHQALQVIESERGRHFDPVVVDAFLARQAEFKDIAQRFADTDADMQQKMEYMANAIAEKVEAVSGSDTGFSSLPS